jgi:outer membrane protein OmpA-like peptidoglycan-associated protein
MKFFKTISAFILLLVISSNLNAQITYQENDFLSQDLILSVQGGFGYGFSDYKNSALGAAVQGSIEYYPIIIQDARLGFKVFGGGQQLNFSDPRISMSSIDEPREVVSPIYTDIIQIGIGLSFGYALSENVIPTISIGTAYLNFSPKNSDGNSLEYNALEKYSKGIFVFALEGNLKVKLTDRLSMNTSISYFPTSTDYIEDVAASDNNDTFLSGLLGLSYAFSGNFDSDGDNIGDKQDMCPDEKEDLDGFEDKDGCPDPDNDKDGIIDARDKCSNEAEDLDGFEDYDGCPDIDNDRDGILDVKDGCPNESEDNDGFEDEDGCPDADNDKDGILDIQDQCPNEVETKNNYLDEDGCPDVAPNQEMVYQFNLRGEDTFNNGSSYLKESSKLVLNEIAFYIQNQIGSKWRIEGHMDSQGSVYTIKKISYDRAKTVFDYLVAQGVSPNQLEVYGLGDSFPIGNNNTQEGRNSNRRIMIIRED